MENWAEISRLHRSEKIPLNEIARKLGIARNTVRAALASDRPPKYERAGRGSLIYGVDMDVRKLLVEYPRMPATVIAERIGWQYSITTLKDRIRAVRPEYASVDPVDRTELFRKCFGHVEHPSARTEILTALETTRPTAVPNAGIRRRRETAFSARTRAHQFPRPIPI